MTGTGAISLTPSSTITLTAGAASTWGTTAGNLTLQVGGTGTTARVLIGAGNGGAGSSTPDIFGLDVKSDTGDPTGFNGAMYYNEFSDQFRCYTNGFWGNCDTTGGTATLQQSYASGETISVTSGEGALSITGTSANIDFLIGSGTDSGDFRIWDGTSNWFLVDESADTVAIGGAAGSGITLGGTGITTTNAGALTVTQTLTSNGALTINGGTTIGDAVTDNLTVASAIQGTNALIFDGSTDDTNETTLVITNPTGDNTITFKDASGTIAFTSDILNATLTDNTTNAYDLEEGVGGRNYLNINTTNSSENISFGNATTNPTFSFLGSGLSTFSGGTTTNGTLTASGNFATPAGTNFATTGTTSDLDFGTGSLFRYTGSDTATFNSIAGGTDGRQIRIINASPTDDNLTLANETGATAANRILTTSGANLTIPVNVSVGLQYDSAAASGVGRWRVVILPATAATVSSFTFVNGGNAFGATATLGTTDANTMSLITAGNTRFSVAAGGAGAATLTGTGTTTLTSTGSTALDATTGLSLGTATATSVSIGATGVATTNNGTLTSTQTLTASNGFTQTTGALNLTATSGALTLSGLSASSVSTGVNNLIFTSGNFNTTATGINSTAIGATTASTGKFTTLTSTGATDLANAGASNVTIATTGTGNVTLGNSTGTFALTSSGGLNVTTGGALTGVASIDTITHSATAITFAGAGTVSSTGANALTLDGGSSGVLNLNNTSTGDILIGGGSGSTGCTITNSTGALACAGAITTTATSGNQGWWNRTGTTISPVTAGDVITTSGNISTSGSGAITSAATLTASSGLTMTTGALSLTSTSGSISSTGLTALTQTLSSGTAALTAPTLNLNTSSTGSTAIGNSTGTFALTSSGGLNVTTGGALTGVASIDTIATSATALTFAGAGTVSSTGANALTLDGGSSGVLNLNNTSTGNILLGGGSGSTGCTLTNSTGAFACTAAVTGSNISGTNTGDITLAAIGATPNANGATLSSQVLNLQPADASFGGVVTTGTQTLAGAKTFSSLLIGTAGLTITGAAISLNDSSNFAVSIAGGTSTGTVNIGTGTGVQALHFGDGGTGAKTLTIGSTASSSTTNIQAGTGSILLAGQATGTSATFLKLPVKTDAGDPTTTQTNGAMYYNSNTGKFRCFENSAWANCIGSGGGTGTGYTIVEKTADESTNTDTTLSNDTDLQFSASASTAYVVEFIIRYHSSSATPDFKYTVTGPTGAIFRGIGIAYDGSSDTGNVNIDACNIESITTLCQIIGTQVPDFLIHITGIMEVQGTAGTVAFQWAQINSNATDITVDQDSILRYLTLSGASGADLAELYATNDANIMAGDVVSLDASLQAGVKKSQSAGDQNAIGIISTTPGLVVGNMSKEGSRNVLVALSGRVPVRVTSENGTIRAGDYLTPSSVPGVAMKATKAGMVIGQALQDYNFPDSDSGLVLAFVKNTYFDGERAVDKNGGTLTSTALLQKMLTDKAQPGSGVNMSEITTDKVSAGLEIITPKVTTQEMLTDVIKPSLSSQLSIQLGPDGSITFGEAGQTPTVTIDAFGNATFAGTLTAKTIRADSIEGLQIFTDQLSSLEDKYKGLAALAAVAAAPPVSEEKTALPALSADAISAKNMALDTLTVNLSAEVLGKLIASGGLIVSGKAEFEGETLFRKIATFFGDVLFKGNVMFSKTPTFNSDTAGFAVIAKGQKSVDITFDEAYAKQPIVSVTLTTDENALVEDAVTDKNLAKDIRAVENDFMNAYFDGDIKYIVMRKSEKGFTIILNKNAPSDLMFSWVALAVKGSKTFFSQETKEDALPDEDSAPVVDTAPPSVSEPENIPQGEVVPQSSALPAPEPIIDATSLVLPTETHAVIESVPGEPATLQLPQADASLEE